MNSNTWSRVVRVGITALIIVFVIRAGGDLIVGLFSGEFVGKSFGEIIGDVISGVFNWLWGVLNYALFGRG